MLKQWRKSGDAKVGLRAFECLQEHLTDEKLLFPDKTQNIRENFMLSETHANGMSRFGEMMLRISELILARTQHMQAISNFLLKHPDLEIPQLYKEMFF